MTNIGDTAFVSCPCGNVVIGIGEALRASRYCGGDVTHGGEWEMAYVAPCDFTDLARNICEISKVRLFAFKCFLILHFVNASIFPLVVHSFHVCFYSPFFIIAHFNRILQVLNGKCRHCSEV